jgi:hypothetical protein
VVEWLVDWCTHSPASVRLLLLLLLLPTQQQIKDRHNGNILLDAEGHLIHIDFGFLLGSSPGGNLGFEGAPFKLTKEWVQLLDGPRSATFRRFRSLCVKAFLAARAHYHQITLLVEMALAGSADLPCFTKHGPRETVSWRAAGDNAAAARARLSPCLPLSFARPSARTSV